MQEEKQDTGARPNDYFDYGVNDELTPQPTTKFIGEPIPSMGLFKLDNTRDDIQIRKQPGFH